MTDLNGARAADFRGHIAPRTIAILPMGSTEPHGPHLPLDTDALLASARASRAGALLEELGLRSMVLPVMPYGVTRLAQDFDGGVTLRPGTLWAFIEDVVLSLQQDGIRQLVICNGHHEYDHERILRNICTDYCARGEGACQVIYPEALCCAQSQVAEEECFGGNRETSMMLAVAPQLVDLERARTLPEFTLQLPVPKPNRNRSLPELGAADGYIGAPALATAEQGEQLLEAWAAELVEGCKVAWPDLFGASN